MNCNVQIEKNFNTPVLAETYRALLGLALMFVGLYVTLFCDFQKHDLGLLLVFASPFVILKDDEN